MSKRRFPVRYGQSIEIDVTDLTGVLSVTIEWKSPARCTATVETLNSNERVDSIVRRTHNRATGKQSERSA